MTLIGEVELERVAVTECEGIRFCSLQQEQIKEAPDSDSPGALKPTDADWYPANKF